MALGSHHYLHLLLTGSSPSDTLRTFVESWDGTMANGSWRIFTGTPSYLWILYTILPHSLFSTFSSSPKSTHSSHSIPFLASWSCWHQICKGFSGLWHQPHVYGTDDLMCFLILVCGTNQKPGSRYTSNHPATSLAWFDPPIPEHTRINQVFSLYCY